MKNNQIITILTLLCSFCILRTVVGNEISFAFSDDPAKSRDHLILPFPDDGTIDLNGLALSIQVSRNLTEWEALQTVFFELDANGQIGGFLVRSELISNGGGLELVWGKTNAIFATALLTLNNEALSFVSSGTKEIHVFIGNYTFTQPTQGTIRIQSLEYTQRTPNRFFRVAPSSLVISN